jgi:rhodanese-related sulfurtransferase
MADINELQGQQEDVQILDVREPYEWEAGHIEGAVHVPLAEVLAGRERGRVATDKPVLVICRSGNRSELAAVMLQARGIDAQNVEGGMEAWARAGLPFVSSKGEPGEVA